MKSDYELIVIGSGVAGMTAAIRARENGVRDILILEKSPYVGGNSRAAGGVFATGGKTVAAQGLSMDTQAYYESAMKQLQFSVDPALVKRYIFNTGDALDWLSDTGLKFEVKKMPFGCVMATIEDPSLAEPYKKSAPTSHSYMGTAMVQKLQELCRDQGIEVLTDTPAKELLTGPDGSVTGVRAGHDGTRRWSSPPAVWPERFHPSTSSSPSCLTWGMPTLPLEALTAWAMVFTWPNGWGLIPARPWGFCSKAPAIWDPAAPRP